MSIETFVELLKKSDLELYSLEKLQEDVEAEEVENNSGEFLVESVKSKFFDPSNFYFFGLEDLVDDTIEGGESELYKFLEKVGSENLNQFFVSFLKFEGSKSFESSESEEFDEFQDVITEFSSENLIVLVRSYSDFGGSFEEVLVSLK